MKKLLLATVLLALPATAHADSLPGKMLGCWAMPTEADNTPDRDGMVRRGDSGKHCDADFALTDQGYSGGDSGFCALAKVKQLSATAYEVTGRCGKSAKTDASLFELRDNRLYITDMPTPAGGPLLLQWNSLADKCGGNSDPETREPWFDACAKKLETVSRELKKLGFCYGMKDDAAADRRWGVCTANSERD